MFVNISVPDAAAASYRYYDAIKSYGFTSLPYVKSGAYALSIETLRSLRQSFTEIRIKCYKPCFGKKVDVVISNSSHIDEQVGLSLAIRKPIRKEIDFRFLTDDELNTFYPDHTYFKFYEDLYYNSIFISGIATIGIRYAHRMECGDYHYIEAGILPGYVYDPIGEWQFFFR